MRLKTPVKSTCASTRNRLGVRLIIAAALLWCIFHPQRLFGQMNHGQIAGTVTDPAQAPVPGVEIAAKDIQTGQTISVTTQANGSYVLVNLSLGTYVLTFQAKGFQQHVVEHVLVDADLRTTLDVSLKLGSVNEAVTVVDETPPLQDETAALGRTVESKQISDLALNGRNPINLTQLKAGVVSANAFNSFNPVDLSANLSINGGQQYGNNITVDGVPIVRSRGDGQSAPTLVGIFNVDALQEVQILTATYPAEYGRGMDGQVHFVTKSGTSQYHGSAWEFFRNSALDANTWVRNNSRTADANSASPLRYNQPGYTIGGPVYIPKHFNTDRSKLFFFLSQEWIFYHQNVETTQTVPTQLMRQGNFSELLNPSNIFFKKATALQGPGISGNIIPVSKLSPNGLGLLRAFPLPTPGFQQGSTNYYSSQPQPNDSLKTLVHLDYLAGANHFGLSASYLSFHEDDPFRTGFDVADTRWNRPNVSAAFNWSTTFSPTLVNEFTATIADDVVRMTLYPIDGVNRYERSLYGINFPYAIPGPKRIEDRIPTINITGFSTLDGSSKPGNSSGPMESLQDNVTAVLSHGHTLKFGGYWELAKQVNADQVGTNQNGVFTFANTGNPLSTGVAIANTAIGNYNTYSEIGPAADTTVVSNGVELYLQDTWKVTPRISLEYGVRWSYFQPWYAIWNDIANFDAKFYNPATKGVVDPKTGAIVSGDPYDGIVLPGNGYPASAAGRAQGAFVPNVQRLFHNLPRGFVDSYFGNFAPRLGVAWRATDKTVIRVGGGIFKDREFLLNGSLFRNAPNQAAVNASNGQVDNPAGAAAQLPFTIGALADEYRYPAAYNYSFTIQRELPLGIIGEIAYVGKIGTNLLRTHNINQLSLNSIYQFPSINANALRPVGGLGPLNYSEQSGRSDYNSLQLSFDRRFRSGLGFGVAYTFSKNLDNTQTPYNGYQFVWAPSLNDRTHVLTINYIYELPFFRRGRTLWANLLGNWQISGVATFRSGDPLSVVDSTDNAGVGSGSASQPWNLVGNIAATGPSGVGLPWFNPAAFAKPPLGTFGNAGLDILRGPWFWNWDTALFKNFTIAERVSSELRFEAFDVLNHPVLSDPIVTPTSGSFGSITQKTDNRNLQLALKLRF